MDDQKEEVLTPYTLADRNEILVKYANFSFKEALVEVKDELKICLLYTSPSPRD